jgi:uracil phosphoribosyltransferase
MIAYMQIRGMHTLIRDAQITKHDFVFYADRLIRLVSKTCFIFTFLI